MRGKQHSTLTLQWLQCVLGSSRRLAHPRYSSVRRDGTDTCIGTEGLWNVRPLGCFAGPQNRCLPETGDTHLSALPVVLLWKFLSLTFNARPTHSKCLQCQIFYVNFLHRLSARFSIALKLYSLDVLNTPPRYSLHGWNSPFPGALRNPLRSFGHNTPNKLNWLGNASCYSNNYLSGSPCLPILLVHTDSSAAAHKRFLMLDKWPLIPCPLRSPFFCSTM